MQPLVTESIGEAPSEIEETKPTQLLATDDVWGAEVSTGRQKIGEASNEIDETKPMQLLATDDVGGAEVSTGKQQIGEAPNEIYETKPTHLLSTDDVGEAETSTRRQQDLSSRSDGKKKEAWQFNQSKEDLGKLFKDKFNQFEDIEELEKFLLAVKEDLQITREKAKSKKAKKKWWGKKAQEGESGGESKLWSKGRASISDTEEVLQKISDIGVKPATASGNKVASESYNLLHEVLKGIGNLHWAAVGFSMFAFFLDRVKEVGDNSGKCLDLLETMCALGLHMVKAFPHLPQNDDLLWRMSTEITNGVSLCCRYKKSGGVSRFAFSTVNKDDFKSLSDKLKELSRQFLRAIEVAHLEKQSETFEAVQEAHREILTSQTSLSNILTELKEIRRNPVSSAHEPEYTTKTGYGAFCNFQHLPRGILGIDILLKDITEKLRNLGDGGTLGLVGMGGVGKTTLAKAVFNELLPDFEYSCFVADVKLKEGNCNVIMEEALRVMYYKGKKVGDKLDWSALNGKRLLLVLDDISNIRGDLHEEVLSKMRDVAAFESRFIVTSREEDIVRNLGKVYPVPFLNEDAALKLFKSYAFPSEEILPQTLQSHMGTIVKKCEGLPLTLTVLGKFLKGQKDEEFWRQTIQALVRADDEVSSLNNKLWAKLRPSYEWLTREEKQIFLDATTFFSHSQWTLGHAKAAWRAAYGRDVETLQWQTLVDLSLVYDVREDESIKVHELLRSLGRKIANEASNDGECRVWDGNLGLQMLESTDMMKGKEFHAFRVRRLGLHVGNSRWGDEFHIPSTALFNFRKLHFFEAENPVIIDGAKEDGWVPSELVILKYVGQNLFNPALQTRLAILDLSELEYLPDSIGQLSSLHHLRIHKSPHLSLLPESFGMLSSLRHLEISLCTSLQALPESIGQLTALCSLDLGPAVGLQSLPESFGKLSSLNYFQLWFCKSLLTLPDSFGGLSSLNYLSLRCENLRTLPDSFGDLSSLNNLNLRCENLCTLPDSFGDLSSLSNLHLRCENLSTLPDSFERLSSLNRLDLWCKNLCTLPASFGDLSSLSHLLFWECRSLHTLPESFGGLSSLNHLKFGRMNFQYLPDSFGSLSSLKHLQFRECSNLVTLPQSFGQLKTLRNFELSRSSIQSLPATFWELSALTHLEWDCPYPGLPESIGRLPKLQWLKIWYFSAFVSPPKWFNLPMVYSPSIPDSIKSLPSLETLKLKLDGDSDIDFSHLPSWLTELNEPMHFRNYSSIDFKVRDGCFKVKDSKYHGTRSRLRHSKEYPISISCDC